MAEEDIRSFDKAISKVFNANGDWSCEFCFWIDCDQRICDGCAALREALNKAGNN